jgi:hypothetical protein
MQPSDSIRSERFSTTGRRPTPRSAPIAVGAIAHKSGKARQKTARRKRAASAEVSLKLTQVIDFIGPLQTCGDNIFARIALDATCAQRALDLRAPKSALD